MGNKGTKKFARMKTHIKGLDECLQGGIPHGFIVLVCGPSGSLKTSFACNVVYNVALQEKKKGVYVSLEQNQESILHHVTQLGMKMDLVENMLIISDLSSLRKGIGDAERKATNQINWFESVITLLMYLKKSQKFEVLVIDSINALFALETLANPRNELFYFFEKLRALDSTILLITETSRDSQNFSQYGVEEFLADGIIYLYHDMEKGTRQRAIEVVKMRGVNHSASKFPLVMEENEITVYLKE